MVLTRGLELRLLQLQQESPPCDISAQNSWQQAFDLICLSDALRLLIMDDNDFSLNLQDRLGATLADQQLGDKAVRIATTFLVPVEQGIKYTAA